MSDGSITPSIQVTLGRQARLYHAFITTAPARLDAPSTLTLYAGPLKDIAGLAVDDLPTDVATAAISARLVLIDTTELASHRARCRAQAHRLTLADPVVVGTTMRLWLWRRTQSQGRHRRQERRP